MNVQNPLQPAINSFQIETPDNYVRPNDSGGNTLTMIPSKNPKDMIVVNFKEIPETVCVETRFITQALAAQKRNEDIFYMTTKNGQLEFSRNDDQMSLKNCRYNLTKKPTLTVSITQKTLQHPLPTNTTTTPGDVQLSTSSMAPGGVPLITALSNYTNNDFGVMSNMPQLKPQLPTVSIPLNKPSHLHNFNIQPPMTIRKLKETKDSESMTDPKPIHCNQIQQTDTSSLRTVSIGIQCEINEGVYEWPEIVEEAVDPMSEAFNLDVEKEEFLQYVEKNSIQYKNQLRECLVCGEISKKSKYFYGHMTIHRGPKALCFTCGQYLDHQTLLENHKCQETKKKKNTFLRCPHYSCGALTISRLELYDHINEHTNYRMHKCSVCHKAFCTTQEYLRHLLLRAKCYTGAKPRRFRLYGLESRKDRLCRVRVFTLFTEKRRTTLVKTFLSKRTRKQNNCKLCLKSYRNKFVLNRHFNKCLLMFGKRLKRKEQRKTGMSKENGIM